MYTVLLNGKASYRREKVVKEIVRKIKCVYVTVRVYEKPTLVKDTRVYGNPQCRSSRASPSLRRFSCPLGTASRRPGLLGRLGGTWGALGEEQGRRFALLWKAPADGLAGVGSCPSGGSPVPSASPVTRGDPPRLSLVSRGPAVLGSQQTDRLLGFPVLLHRSRLSEILPVGLGTATEHTGPPAQAALWVCRGGGWQGMLRH